MSPGTIILILGTQDWKKKLIPEMCEGEYISVGTVAFAPG